MSKKTSLKKKENLWLKAIDQNDTQLAIDAAKFMGDVKKLHAIALDSLQKQDFIACENACKALGFKFTSVEYNQIKEALSKANKRRKTSILRMENILELLVNICQNAIRIRFIRSYVTSRGATICLGVKIKNAIALGMGQVEGYSSPSYVWPDFFPAWYNNLEDNLKACENWAYENASAVFIELLPQAKIKKREINLVEQALSCLQKENDSCCWGKFQRLLTNWEKNSIKPTPKELAKIERGFCKWFDEVREIYSFNIVS